jgi:hypothetical protein
MGPEVKTRLMVAGTVKVLPYMSVMVRVAGELETTGWVVGEADGAAVVAAGWELVALELQPARPAHRAAQINNNRVIPKILFFNLKLHPLAIFSA